MNRTTFLSAILPVAFLAASLYSASLKAQTNTTGSEIHSASSHSPTQEKAPKAKSESRRDDLKGFIETRKIMGVQFKVSLYAVDQGQAEKAFNIAFKEISKVDKIFSNYKPKSEAKKIIARPAGTWTKVSFRMHELLKRSQKFHKVSDGYFDIAAGNLTKVWRIARKEKKVPEDSAIQESLQNSGMRWIQVDQTKKRFQHTNSKIELDFGGIAKGYAADRAIEKLKEAGFTRVLIDASGDLTAGDPPPGTDGWKVAIANIDTTAKPKETILLANQSVATSGDAYQFLQTKKGRLGHIIDPKTGQPVKGRRSCTVIAKSGTTADALATIYSVVPEDNIPNIADQFPNSAFKLILVTSEELRILEHIDWNKKIKKVITSNKE